ncbi:MAG: pyroglutamyl-peptidase I [Alistipes sp.]|nr:pyroglutamyl-peptidase I [Alistipes sp.]
MTGFEPYWDYPENSSWAVAEKVTACGMLDVDIVAEQMPVSFERVATAIRNAVEKHRPDLIIMLGQSGGSDRVKLERVALNMMDSKLADNDGVIPNEELINTNTPTALFTNMPIKSLRTAIEEQGVAVKISNSCGLYVCNRLYYEVLLLCQEQPQIRAIFVHLPFYEGQPSAKLGKPTMPLDDMARAIQTIIKETYDKSGKI